MCYKSYWNSFYKLFITNFLLQTFSKASESETEMVCESKNLKGMLCLIWDGAHHLELNEALREMYLYQY